MSHDSTRKKGLCLFCDLPDDVFAVSVRPHAATRLSKFENNVEGIITGFSNVKSDSHHGFVDNC